MTFSEYVAFYGLSRSEGVLLRYLADAYRALRRTVPQDARTEELTDLVSWLGELVRGVDSSLLDEWEALAHPDPDELGPDGAAAAAETGCSARHHGERAGLHRHGAQRAVPPASNCCRRDATTRSASWTARAGWPAHVWADAMAAYWDEYPDLGIGAARAVGGHGPDQPRAPRAGSCGRSSTTRRVTGTGDCPRRWTSLRPTRPASRC